MNAYEGKHGLSEGTYFGPALFVGLFAVFEFLIREYAVASLLLTIAGLAYFLGSNSDGVAFEA